MATTSKMEIPYPASTDFVKDGATDMQALAEEVDKKSGLVKVTPGAVSAGGTINADGSVTFSGAVSIEVRNVFTSDFANYKIMVSNFQSGTGTTREIRFRLMDNTTESATANYNWVANYTHGSNTGAFAATNNATFAFIGASSNDAGAMGHFNFDIFTPQQNLRTTWTYTGLTYQADAANYIYRFGACTHWVTDDYNGFKIFGVTDNIQGTIRVYGYN